MSVRCWLQHKALHKAREWSPLHHSGRIYNMHTICLFTLAVEKTTENTCKWDIKLQADYFSHAKQKRGGKGESGTAECVQVWPAGRPGDTDAISDWSWDAFQIRSTPLGHDTVSGKYRGSIHQLKICPNANMSLFFREWVWNSEHVSQFHVTRWGLK